MDKSVIGITLFFVFVTFLLILLVYIKIINHKHKYLLFLEDPQTSNLEAAADWSTLYTYTLAYYDLSSNRHYKGEFCGIFTGVSSSDTLQMRVIDDDGNIVGSAITFSSAGYLCVPFSIKNSTYIRLQYKTSSLNIELKRLEIDFD